MGPAAPARIGPYVVERQLGSGGMGSVYAARRDGSAEAVAVKVVRVPNRAGLQGIRREIHALSRIRHPGVVRIVDEGVEEGLPWYAMELCPGASLRQEIAGEADAAGTTQAMAWATTAPSRGDVAGAEAAAAAAAAPPSRERLALRLSLARRLCGPLAFLHGEGMVHRDLKPENVIVGAGGQPVIVDFGLVSRFSGDASRERLDVPGTVAGTYAYMAPEQARGELPDARADLYALGCMLYELATGRTPFLGGPMQVLMAHLKEAPAPPSSVAPWLPPALDDLVMRLLEKEPRDRPGHATDVAAALAPLSDDGGAAAVGTADAGGGPVPRPYLYRSGFVGRRREVARLEEAMAALREGRGAVVLVSGESGAGKTRVVMEATAWAALQGMDVLAGECAPAGTGDGGGPLHGLRRPLQAIADRCREAGTAEVRRVLGPRGPVLAAYEPSIASLPGMEEEPPPAPLPAEAARLRVLGHLADALAALGERTPQLLVIDDVHWADDLTLGFLTLLVRGDVLAHARVLVVAVFRADEAPAPLRELLEGGGVVPVTVGRLQPGDVEAMAREMLGVDASPPFLQALVGQAEGNPFFVAEYLRAAIAQDLLARDASGQWRPRIGDDTVEEACAALPLPASVHELVTRHMEGLSGGSRRLLNTAAAAGREALESLISVASGLDDTEVLEAAHELVSRLLLESKGDALRFTHDKIREVAYGAISPEERPGLHRRLAEAMESGPPGWLDENAAAAGHHWDRAGEPARAAPYYLKGAREAAARHALVEAERLYRAHLAAVPPGSVEDVLAANELGDAVLSLLGREDLALPEHARALDGARRLGRPDLESASLCGLARGHAVTGRPAEAQALYEQSLAISRSTGGQVRALVGLADVHRDRGDALAARALYEEARARLGDGSDPGAMGRVLGKLAGTHLVQGETVEAEALFRKSLAIQEAAGDRREQGITLGNLAALRNGQGHLADAMDLYGKALALLREAGDRRSEAVTTLNLATAHFARGDHAESGRLHALAAASAHRLGDARVEGIAIGYIGTIHDAEDDLPGALRCYERSLELLRRVGDRRFEVVTLVNVAKVLQRQGDLAGARASLEEGIRILRPLGDVWNLGHALRRLGQIEIQLLGDEHGFALLAEASEMLGSAGDLRSLWETRLFEAAMERSARGDLLAARRRLDEARATAVALEDADLVRACDVEGVFLLLAEGRDASEALAALLAGTGGAPEEQRRQAADAAAAVAARDAGIPLHAGQLPDQLAPAMRDWLTRQGRLPPPSTEPGPGSSRNMSGS